LLAGVGSTATPDDDDVDDAADRPRLWLAQPAVWVPLAIVLVLLVGAMLMRPRPQAGHYDVKAAFFNPGYATVAKSEPPTPPPYA
jgi:hypothetical protein